MPNLRTPTIIVHKRPYYPFSRWADETWLESKNFKSLLYQDCKLEASSECDLHNRKNLVIIAQWSCRLTGLIGDVLLLFVVASGSEGVRFYIDNSSYLSLETWQSYWPLRVGSANPARSTYFPWRRILRLDQNKHNSDIHFNRNESQANLR